MPARERARVHHQRAVHRAVRAYSVGGETPSPEKRDEILAELEKAHALCPESWSVATDLYWIYRKAGRGADADALAERLEKGERRISFLDSWLAARLNDRGEFRRALDLAEKTPWPLDSPLRLELVLEKMRAMLGLGDLAGILELYGKRIGSCEDDESRLHILFHVDQVASRLPRAALANVDAAALEKSLRARADESDSDLGWHVALSTLLARLGRTADELSVLVRAVDRFAGSVEFRHFFARAAWRILASNENAAVP